MSCKNICFKCRKSHKIKKAPEETPANDKSDFDQEAQIKDKIVYRPRSNSHTQENIKWTSTNDQTSNDKSSDDQISNPVNDRDYKAKDTELPLEINIDHIKIDDE